MNRDHDWKLDGACNEVGTELFYPEKGDNAGPAVRICCSCPVLEQCRRHALDNHEDFGVWGGLTVTQRREIRQATARNNRTLTPTVEEAA